MAMTDSWSTRDHPIDLSEAYDVRESCVMLGCSEAQLRDAVRVVGCSAAAIGAYLCSAGNLAVARRASV
jgi:hypothetical protein